MYEELVKRLRDCRNMAVFSKFWWDITTEAAEAIEELQAGEKKFLRNISALEMENENLKRARRWIPVTERLPKPGEESLVLVSKSGMEVALYEAGFYGEAEWFTTSGKLEGVTHWMPLPEPPEEETE